MTLRLLEVVRLTRDVPGAGLAAGALGTVVDLLAGDGTAYEVEVVDDEGRTVFLGPLAADDLAPARLRAVEVEPDDAVTARRVAEQVRERGGMRGGWFEVRTLMSEFGIERYSQRAQERMTAALTSAGLTLEPPLSALTRSETVVLSVPVAAAGEAGIDRGRLAEVLTIRTADAGAPVRHATLDEPDTVAHDGGVRWFDISDSSDLDAGELRRLLNPHCGGRLTRDMVEDLLSPDPRPRIKRHGEDAEIRCVAAFQVQACESDEGAAAGSTSKAGLLIFEPVEFLVGEGWLITCWHHVEVYRGAKRIRESPPDPPASLFREVERCWTKLELSSAGDLALLVLNELALTYAPAFRQFYEWEEEWELDFYRRPDRIDRETLLEVRAAAAVFRDWLSPLNPPGMSQDAERGWFPGVTGSAERGGNAVALGINTRIDNTLDGLRGFGDTLRSAYDLLQLREGERERERDDRFQRNIAIGGAVILIPTLVAGVMGANTWVPGQSGPGSEHWAFLVLIAILILAGLAAWGAIRWLQNRDARKS